MIKKIIINIINIEREHIDQLLLEKWLPNYVETYTNLIILQIQVVPYNI